MKSDLDNPWYSSTEILTARVCLLFCLRPQLLESSSRQIDSKLP